MMPVANAINRRGYSNLSPTPASSAIRRITNSAVTLRQILPWQTKRIFFIYCFRRVRIWIMEDTV